MLEPQLFEDIPLRLDILSGPLADHWPSWEGDPTYYYKITFESGTTGQRYERQYRQGLPKPPYEAIFFEGQPISVPIFQTPVTNPDEEAIANMVATALDEWQQSQ